ncbi:hypothetical protein LV779_17000 [Streptomyces thinghirensis]|nr:hypothetical protein [Streptomyces thinghirensis]
MMAQAGLPRALVVGEVRRRPGHLRPDPGERHRRPVPPPQTWPPPRTRRRPAAQDGVRLRHRRGRRRPGRPVSPGPGSGTRHAPRPPIRRGTSAPGAVTATCARAAARRSGGRGVACQSPGRLGHQRAARQVQGRPRRPAR